MALKSTLSHFYVDVRQMRLLDVGSRLGNFAYESRFERIPPTGEPIFVTASRHTGLNTRSLTRRSIKVGIREERGHARAEARALATVMHLTHLKVAQPKQTALRPQVCHCWTGPAGEPAGRANNCWKGLSINRVKVVSHYLDRMDRKFAYKNINGNTIFPKPEIGFWR